MVISSTGNILLDISLVIYNCLTVLWCV